MKQNLDYSLFNSDKTIKKLPFQIRTYQRVPENGKENDCTARSNDHFEIIWITKGAGTNCIDLQKSDIKNNKLFFIKPGQVYMIDEANVFEGYIISFTESFLNIGAGETDSTYHASLFQLFSNASGILINHDIDDMKYIAERMINEFESFNAFRVEILRRYFKIFLIYVARQFEGLYQIKRQSRNIELVQKFMALLERSFRTQKMVTGYADQLFITPNYLNEIVKKATGYSAGHHIRQRIVMEAKRRAAYSDISMKEIAYYLGFSDMAHFSKFFKNVTGMNFTDFKKEKFVFLPLSSISESERA